MKKPTILIFLLPISILTYNLFAATSLSAQSTIIPQVTTQNGDIKGVDDSGVFIFRGIPFAQPPVGNLRWKPPQSVQKWKGVKEATSFGPRCMQRPVFGDMNFRSDGMSEDCLYLNVWTPSLKRVDKLPVLVYFYGGGLIAGYFSDALYDVENIALIIGIVSITVNYRLTVFGFMSHPELSIESPHKASGNYGLLDQTAALQWVKENITAFGGDPSNITIVGESAGSMSVSAQMASPLSRDLIAGAVGESGSILGTLPAVTLKEGEESGMKFQEMTSAASLKELREMSADKLLEVTAQEEAPRFSATVDGYFFPKSPIEIYRSGEQAEVPLFYGWNSEEMTYQFLFRDKAPTPSNYVEIVDQLYENHADKILELYPGKTRQQVITSATALAGDRFIAFSTWKWGEIHSKTSSSSIYRYYYARPRPPMTSKYKGTTAGLAGGVQNSRENNSDSESESADPKGAVHSAEIEYIMGNLPSNKVYAWTPEDYQVSYTFQNYLANFVKTKDPNGLGVPKWKPLNNKKNPGVMHINVTTQFKPIKHSERERYEFLDMLAYQRK